MTDPLLDFWAARIAEDEADAVSVGMGRERMLVDPSLLRYANRVLAECEAKRRIMEHWKSTVEWAEDPRVRQPGPLPHGGRRIVRGDATSSRGVRRPSRLLAGVAVMTVYELIQAYTGADDATMMRLMATCDRIDNRACLTARPWGEAMPAALELVKAGVPLEEIIDHHLDAAEDVAGALHCTLADAALLVAQASHAFRLDASSIQLLPSFVKQVKGT